MSVSGGCIAWLSADCRLPLSGVCVRRRFLTVAEKKEVGRLCKLLIDQGRAEYLRRHGFRPALQYYTEPGVSPENVLLTAVPHQPRAAADA